MTADRRNQRFSDIATPPTFRSIDGVSVRVDAGS
jgi:hypothetical protein